MHVTNVEHDMEWASKILFRFSDRAGRWSSTLMFGLVFLHEKSYFYSSRDTVMIKLLSYIVNDLPE